VEWAHYSSLAGDRDEGSTGSGDEWLKDCWLRNGMYINTTSTLLFNISCMKRTYGQKLLVFGWEVIGDAGSSQQMVP
ncbi:hypothetical protein Tco_1282388, partial [Tanacetum coccineum]